MNAGDWIGLASAVVAGVAALIAIAQARSARDAASSARRQADSAEEQVAIMRTQLEADLADRDEAAGPQFALKDATERFPGERYVTATLVLLSGPPLSHVTIRLGGQDARQLMPSMHADFSEGTRERTWKDISPVASLPVIAWMEHEAIGPLHLTLELDCTERDGRQRNWHRACSQTAQPEPPEPSPFRRYRDDD